MIYAASIDHGGRVRVHTYKDAAHYLETAGDFANVPKEGRTVAQVMQAFISDNAFYEVFATEWHAATALSCQRLPDEVANALGAAIENRARVAVRPYLQPAKPK